MVLQNSSFQETRRDFRHILPKNRGGGSNDGFGDGEFVVQFLLLCLDVGFPAFCGLERILNHGL